MSCVSVGVVSYASERRLFPLVSIMWAGKLELKEGICREGARGRCCWS